MEDLQTDQSDDQRDVEISSLVAIFPELSLDQDDAHSFSYEVPVNPSTEVIVSFPAATDGIVPNPAGLHGDGRVDQVESHVLSYLPSVQLHLSLPVGYPDQKAPAALVSTSPPWLPEAVAKRLENDCARLWDELGRDLVAFTYIDHVQQAAEDCFGLVNQSGHLEVDPQHKIAILDHDIKARRIAFDKGTFDCGICLEPKKGTVCHRMIDCGHVFCIQCLQDFYNNAITEGDLASVRCLSPNCAKERETARFAGKSRRRAKVFISPSELLQIPLDQDLVTRYVTLKYKTELESDKNTIYCPRPWCNGAARSKKHKKPDGLEFEEGSDASDVDDEESKKIKPAPKIKDLLSVCEDCGFAFCSRCFQSWHGEFVRCMPRRDKEELTAEEKASIEYMNLHTTPCPTCAAPAQKTHGCNHMICYRCQSHFCYLCSAWLDPSNPYEHFNKTSDGRRTGCYMRLWELEHGDGDNVDYGFAGGLPARQAREPEGAAPADDVPVAEIEEADQEPDDDANDGQVGVLEEDGQDDRGQGGVAREGPLVLRIAAEPRRRDQQPVPPVAPNPPVNARRGQQQGGRRGRGGNPHVRGPAGREGQRQQQRQVQGVNQNAAQAAQRNRAAQGPNHQAGGEAEGLNEAHQAWVRNFVQLALDDNEDLVDSDSDEEEEEVIFWRDNQR